MKSVARTMTVFASLLLFTAPAVVAQTTDTITRVPFAFTIGKTEMPRDTYRVSPPSGHLDVFMISSYRHSAVLLSQPDGREKDARPRLVFKRYGDRYFLREVRLPGNTGFSLPESREERDVADRLASTARPEIVVVHSGQ